MITIHVLIGAVQLVSFIAYASVYSSAIQELKKLYTHRKNAYISSEKNEFEIRQLEPFVKTVSKIWAVPTFILGVLHTVSIALVEGEIIDYLIGGGITFGFLGLNLLARWMKGAGTIDDGNRFGRNPLM